MLRVRKRRAESGTHRASGSRSPGDSKEEGAIPGQCSVSSGRKGTRMLAAGSPGRSARGMSTVPTGPPGPPSWETNAQRPEFANNLVPAHLTPSGPSLGDPVCL